MPDNQKALRIARVASLAGFSGFILYTALAHHLATVHAASLHSYCPFGAIASLGRLVTQGGLAPKIHLSSLVLGIGVLVSGLVVGGAFCGWVCPLGALQDALDWLRRKLSIRELALPKRLDSVLRVGRYVVLAGIILATYQTGKLWFGDYDPYYTIFSLDWLFEPSWERWPAYTVAIALLGGSLFIPRLWCRYLCPLGGLLSLLQRISPIKIRRKASLCIDCGRCDRVCPTRLQVSTERAMTHDCTMCLKCVESCPIKGALEVALPGYGEDKAEEVSA